MFDERTCQRCRCIGLLAPKFTLDSHWGSYWTVPCENIYSDSIPWPPWTMTSTLTCSACHQDGCDPFHAISSYRPARFYVRLTSYTTLSALTPLPRSPGHESAGNQNGGFELQPIQWPLYERNQHFCGEFMSFSAVQEWVHRHAIVIIVSPLHPEKLNNRLFDLWWSQATNNSWLLHHTDCGSDESKISGIRFFPGYIAVMNLLSCDVGIAEVHSYITLNCS